MPGDTEYGSIDQRADLIESINGALGGNLSLEEALLRATRLLVRELGDVVVAIGDGREGRHLAIAHADSSRERATNRLVARYLGPLSRLASEATNAGITSRCIPRVDSASLLPSSTDGAEVLPLLDELEVRSLMVVALQNGSGPIGALAVARTGEDMPYGGTDLAVLQVIARRVAIAVESARLHETMESVALRQSHLEQALHTWTQVFQVAGWGAAIVECAGRTIDVVNPVFARLHGYARPEDLSGRSFETLLPPERAAELERWGESSGPQGLTYESMHRREDGRTVPVLVSVTPLTGADARRVYVVTVQDLTDLKRTEERLRRAQRMDAVGRLAGGVAHEVNNMMTIILGFSDLLARAPELAETLQRDVDEIRKAAMRAGKITQQLLAFSRQQLLQPVELRVNSVLEELLPVLRLLLPANIRVESRLSPLDAVVRADRAQLEQVLINLAFNARDAMSEGGTIRLTTETRYLSEDIGHRLIGVPFPPGEYALLSVIDTGHGMDEATLEQVFEPFFTTKPLGMGTGLGLATVYGIVKQSGGYIWVESTPGEGTTFTVGLPLVHMEAHAEERVRAPRAPQSAASGTVLIVEDEEGVRQLAGRLLRARGYGVLEARNGEEALTTLQRAGREVDLVLTDVVVPDLSVSELVRRIRRQQGEVAILYMSGYPQDEVIQRSLLGANDPFLQKPFTRDELVAGVARLLQPASPVVEG